MFANVISIFMFILVVWALLNISYWYIKGRHKSGNLKYYWQMNAIWNVINLIIAVASLFITIAFRSNYNNNLNTQELIIWILAINILLDLCYVGFGVALENNNKNKPIKYKGWGLSIQLQGAFLFLFDTLFTLTLLIVVI
jgi:hypothetical protein